MNFFLSFLLFFVMSTAIGQRIIGRVVDKDTGDPLPEVSILVIGTGAIAMTNDNGIYSIPVRTENAELVFSLTDYNTKKAQVTKSSTLDIALEKTKLVSYYPATGSQPNADEVKTKNTTRPLFVVDGVAMNSTENPFETIDIDEIENITVLKKKTAAEAYSTLGANGVILIKTKKGKEK